MRQLYKEEEEEEEKEERKKPFFSDSIQVDLYYNTISQSKRASKQASKLAACSRARLIFLIKLMNFFFFFFFFFLYPGKRLPHFSLHLNYVRTRVCADRLAKQAK